MTDAAERFHAFAETCERIASTSKKLEKVSLLASYLRSLGESTLPLVCRMLSGYFFPRWESKELFIGYSSLVEVVKDLSAADGETFRELHVKHGDLGSTAEELLAKRAATPLISRELTLSELNRTLQKMARASGKGAVEERKGLLRGLLLSCSPREAKYLVRLLGREMRIGLVEALVEEALAKAFSLPPEEVRRANLVLADIGETAQLAQRRRLGEAALAPLHPTNFMLADMVPTAEEIAEYYGRELFAEFKYDGVRCQAHKKGGEVKIFTRRLEETSEAFPEIAAALAEVSHDFVADGEIVPMKGDQPLAFHALQHRLRRKTLERRLLEEVPLTLFLYDILYFDGRQLLDDPLKARRLALESIPWKSPVRVSHLRIVSRASEIQEWFERSRELGFEGLVVKDPASPYEPGRRGRYWIKLKRELDTLDVVIVAAEFGHGKRAGLLSDYTFAVRDGDQLRVVGKAYSGLTDDEIAEMTEKLKAITVRDEDYRRVVEPRIVLEVAFDGVQRSSRHDSGFALRFPRIKRIRTDKDPGQIDTIERVREIYRRQETSARSRLAVGGFQPNFNR